MEHGHLIDQGHEGAQVGDVPRGWERPDGVCVRGQGADSVRSDPETGPVDRPLTEDKLVLILQYAVPSTEGQVGCHVLEHLGHRRLIQDGVVDDPSTTVDVHGHLIKAVGVRVAGCLVALWGRFVPVASPRRQEGGKMAVLGADRDGMIAIESIGRGFPMPAWDRHRLLEWGHGGMRLPETSLIQRL